MNEQILVVEDEPNILKLIEIVLKGEKLTPVAAVDVDEAIRHLKSTENDFKLIITDYTLPGAHGGYVAEYVRSQPRIQEIPILLTSANEASRNFNGMMSEGKINAFIAKPFAIPAFKRAVQMLLQNSQVAT